MFIIGDSHAVAFADAAKERGLVWRGGPIGTGKALESKFWAVEDGAFEVTLPIPDKVKARFKELLEFKGPILSVVGFNSHRFAVDIAEYLMGAGLNLRPDSLSSAVFHQCVIEARAEVLNFYRLLLDAERSVYFTHSPNRQPAKHQDLVHAFEAILISEIQALGAHFVDVRETCMVEGRLKPEYCRTADAVHANAKYGGVVIDKFLTVSAAS